MSAKLEVFPLEADGYLNTGEYGALYMVLLHCPEQTCSYYTGTAHAGESALYALVQQCLSDHAQLSPGCRSCDELTQRYRLQM